MNATISAVGARTQLRRSLHGDRTVVALHVNCGRLLGWDVAEVHRVSQSLVYGLAVLRLWVRTLVSRSAVGRRALRCRRRRMQLLLISSSLMIGRRILTLRLTGAADFAATLGSGRNATCQCSAPRFVRR